jgi:hypothetical protein
VRSEVRNEVSWRILKGQQAEKTEFISLGRRKEGSGEEEGLCCCTAERACERQFRPHDNHGGWSQSEKVALGNDDL